MRVRLKANVPPAIPSGLAMLSVLQFAAFVCLVLVHATAGAMPVLRLVPEFTWVTVCKPFDVDVVLTGMDTDDMHQTLGAFDLTFHYDPAQFVLAPAITSFGGGLGDANDPAQTRGVIDTSVVGTVRLMQASMLEYSPGDCIRCEGPFLQDLQRGGVVLARLGVHNYTHQYRLADFTLDAARTQLTDVRGELITAYAIANVTVQIAEPGSLAMVLLALASAAGTAAVRQGRWTRPAVDS